MEQGGIYTRVYVWHNSLISGADYEQAVLRRPNSFIQNCSWLAMQNQSQSQLTLPRQLVYSPDPLDHRAAKTITAATVLGCAVSTLRGRTHAQPLVWF